MHYVERTHKIGVVTKSYAKTGIPQENKGLPHGFEDDWLDIDRWEDEGGRNAGATLGE